MNGAQLGPRPVPRTRLWTCAHGRACFRACTRSEKPSPHDVDPSRSFLPLKKILYGASVDDPSDPLWADETDWVTALSTLRWLEAGDRCVPAVAAAASLLPPPRGTDCVAHDWVCVCLSAAGPGRAPSPPPSPAECGTPPRALVYMPPVISDPWVFACAPMSLRRSSHVRSGTTKGSGSSSGSVATPGGPRPAAGAPQPVSSPPSTAGGGADAAWGGAWRADYLLPLFASGVRGCWVPGARVGGVCFLCAVWLACARAPAKFQLQGLLFLLSVCCCGRGWLLSLLFRLLYVSERPHVRC